MKTMKYVFLIFITFVLVIGACKKSEITDQENTPTPIEFDNSITGLWVVTKLDGNAPVVVNDSFYMRKDKYHTGMSSSGKEFKADIDPDGKAFTLYDNLGNKTNWSIVKNSTSEFQVTGSTFGNNGTFLLKKLRDAPDCPSLTNIEGSGRDFNVVGDVIFISPNSFYSNKHFEYGFINAGELFFPAMPPPQYNNLVDGDTLSYQPFILSCPEVLFIYKGGKWVKQ